MAVVTVSGNPVVGAKYSVTTASSADWASVSNSTYFFDLTDQIVYYKNSSGVVVNPFAGGGLTYFTEAQNTTAPNATVPVDSLTAVASTTNADVAIVPKGTGAILASVPDNTTVGGNKRGFYAVDLQTKRTINTQVASGEGAAILGGKENYATGSYSVTAGNANQASGNYSTAFGNSNTATYDHAVAIGYYNRATSTSMGLGWSNLASAAGSVAIGNLNTSNGNGAIAIGYTNTSSGTRSVAIGDNLTSSGNYSNVSGTFGSDFGVNSRRVFSSNNSVLGDSQKSTFILNTRTTDATATVISVQGGAVGVTTQLTLQNNNVFRVKGSITGKQSGSTNVGVWDIDCVIVRGATAGTTIIAGTPTVSLVVNTGSFGTPTLTANTTLGCLTITVVGASGTNVQWTSVLDTCETIYA